MTNTDKAVLIVIIAALASFFMRTMVGPPLVDSDIPIEKPGTLIIYEEDDKPNYPPEQVNILSSTIFRQHVADYYGKPVTEVFRAYDQDKTFPKENEWSRAMGADLEFRTELPWILISDPPNNIGFRGVLAGSVEDAIEQFDSVVGG